jgi:(S)-ureidoglycine aminohydrolase
VHHLGHTRSAFERDHLLLTPDTFVRAPLPGMRNATAVVHVSPACGAAFTQYTAEFEPGGVLGPAVAQRFVYVVEGGLSVGRHEIGAAGFAYVPLDAGLDVAAQGPARAVVIEKPRLTATADPELLLGNQSAVDSKAFLGDESVQVQLLLPDCASFDFAVNIMTFQPGATLPMVEAHVMEHGLMMLAGEGIYRLSAKWYPVMAGDFIWMAPYCPQWFGALGKTPARYLIYKDWNQHPLCGLKSVPAR